MHRAWWVGTPAPVTWSDAVALGGKGWLVTSKAVLASPPAGCADPGIYCTATGPYPPTSSSGGTSSDDLTVIALATTMALLQIVLLVGPAFAVGLRRRRRDLGLLAINGAHPRQLRQVVLAEGLLLGTVGAILGLVAGWAAVWALRGQLDRLGDGQHWLGMPVVGPLVPLVGVLGVVTAVIAAALPARQAARTDAASAVGRGALQVSQRVQRRRSRRVIVFGLTSVVVGTAIVISFGLRHVGVMGGQSVALITLLGGCIAAELGVVALTPTIVALVAGAARRLPLTPRIALRDAARNRLRSGAAVAAVTASVAAAVAGMVYAASMDARDQRHYVQTRPLGSVLVSLPSDGTATEHVADLRSIRAELPRTLPLKQSWSVATSYRTGVEVPVAERCPVQQFDQEVTNDPRCEPGRGDAGSVFSASAVIGDGDLLAAVTGVDDPAARAALERGDVVVFDPRLISGGQVTVDLVGTTTSDQPPPTKHVQADATVLDRGYVPAQIFMTEATASRLGVPLDDAVVFATTTAVPSAAQVDAATDAAVRVTGDPNTYVRAETGAPTSLLGKILLAIVAVAMLVAAAAAITAASLALTDSKADLSTLAAVGGAPRVRRQLAASQAGVLTLMGALLGAAAGLLPGWSMVHATLDYTTGSSLGDTVIQSTALAVPWVGIALLCVGLPVLTSVVVGLAVRSRVSLVRRID